LNCLGYGEQEELQLNLVYNPTGPVLPPGQSELQADYKRELGDRFGIRFNQLFAITNMPISRFGGVLLAQGGYHDYMTLLRDNFSPANLETIMCKTLLSIDWQGYVYDCDFNQMLELPLATSGQQRTHITDLLRTENLNGAPITIGEHCYGCTAGQGSSCGGAL
jgi:radical SAM/Cys-rich protein